MYTSDKKMLVLMEILKSKNVIRFENDFCEAIGIHKSNLAKVKNDQSKHFTPVHIENAIKAFKVDANWLFGIGDNIFVRHKKVHTEKTATQL